MKAVYRRYAGLDVHKKSLTLINQAVKHIGRSAALCARGAQSSANLVSRYPLCLISRSNGVRSMLMSKGETTPPLRSPALARKELPFAIAFRLEHRPNQTQHRAIGYLLGHEREKYCPSVPCRLQAPWCGG